jgi:hypothetical protein
VITLSEGLALAGVVFAAGAAIERLKRMEEGARSQYKRIGDVVGEVAELRGKVAVMAAMLPAARGVVSGMIPSNLVDDEPPTPPLVPKPVPRLPGK